MEKHRCNFCLKTFVNGRALGGHMRSHMLNLYLNHTPKPSPSSSLSSSEVIKTELSRNTTVRLRSKRVRRPESTWFADQQHFHEVNRSGSSISDTSPEELVACCLMMLSRDKWTDGEEEVHDESESDSDEEVVNVKRTPARNNYRCETCDKTFRSYQALGGHIASHKKIKLNHQFHRSSNQQTLNVSIEDKIHECRVCFKVFASGQALGGHKRSHVAAKQVVKQSIHLIDLNLPAPTEDDDEDDDDD